MSKNRLFWIKCPLFESCVFSQLLNTTAIIGLFVTVVFFKYAQAVGADDSLGKATAILGVIQMFGVMLVGNFQFTSIRFVHFFGAALAFGCGLALALCISIMSAGKLSSPRWLVWMRIGITTVAFISGIIMLVSAFQQGDPAEDDYSRFWANMTDAFEWSLGISLLFFYFSLTYEFSKIKSTKLSITLDTKKDADAQTITTELSLE
ncbi:unnamed protein product [Oikopleura dioica]|uniref:CWH43-like N-terminal domain-containing protein n=1 Tax=Oikopleura dioica TaxID=34765 RepID=E4WU85_OIKDI|nr:unnamed protein product [Oikopleura dioica]